MSSTEPGFISSTDLANFLGVSGMTLFRWQRDAKLNFPQPAIINHRKYWARTAIDIWMKQMAVGKATKVAEEVE